MKLREEYGTQDGLHFKRTTHDATDAIESARSLRELNSGAMGDYAHIGRIPTAMIYEWARQAGVDVNDAEAVREVMTAKLQDGEFAKFRVDERNFW